MVVVDSRRVPRVPRYSGACHEPHHFCVRGYHPLWPVFPDDSTSGSVCNSPALNRAGPTTTMDPKTHRFGLFRVRSPLLTKSLNCFLFLQVLRWKRKQFSDFVSSGERTRNKIGRAHV